MRCQNRSTERGITNIKVVKKENSTNLNVKQVQLDGIGAVNVLVREEELLLKHDDFVDINTLLMEGLVRVQPNG